MPDTDKTKLRTLALDWGYSDPLDMIEDYVTDSLSPAICMNPGCDYSTEMEHDQDRGWCECCGANTVKSAFLLAGMI